MRKSEFCQRLGREAPIVQAPMASSTTPELVTAVSNAGGLGSHGCASFAPDRLAAEIAARPGELEPHFRDLDYPDGTRLVDDAVFPKVW